MLHTFSKLSQQRTDVVKDTLAQQLFFAVVWHKIREKIIRAYENRLSTTKGCTTKNHAG